MDDVNKFAWMVRKRVARYRAAHFRASDNLRKLHYVVGFALILVSAVVSGSLLQSSGGDPSLLTLIAGTLSIVVVVLTSVQTTFKFGERAELHRSAAVGFGRVRDELDVFLGRSHPDTEEAWRELMRIVSEIGSVEAGAPGYLRRTYEKARGELALELRSSRADGAVSRTAAEREGLLWPEEHRNTAEEGR